MNSDPIVIAGGGLAGATAAFELRSLGYHGDIVIVGSETDVPYNRPSLSKGYLRGEEDFEAIAVHSPAAYAGHQVGLRLGSAVVAVRPGEHEIELESGERVRYSKLLLATGGRNRTLPIQRTHLRGIYALRTLRDADLIKAEAAPGMRAAVIGLGFIGSEITASLRQMGVEVVAIEPAKTPLNRVVGDDFGSVLADIHRDHGVELLLGDLPANFEGERDVRGVRTAMHGVVECDFAIVGVGIHPNVEFLEGSGIGIDNGVIVDEYLRTNAPDVFAAGDVANHYNALLNERMRLEHWNNAEWQGRLVAANMLGESRPYAVVPNFWSDQYEHVLEYRGHHTGWDQVVVRGDRAARSFVAFYLSEGRVTAALALDRVEEVEAAVPLIERRTQVDPKRLGDESVELAAAAA